jgi:phosphoglycerate kinase
MRQITYLDDVEIVNKTILLRVDFNVGIDQYKHTISDEQRIMQAIPTIKLLLQNKNKIILISHLGRPKGKFEKKYSLEIVIEKLQEIFPILKFTLVRDFLTEESNTFKHQQNDEIIVLENIRFYKEEKANDKQFAKKLAELGDVYINDAFSVCHREDASVTGLPKLLTSYGGLLLKKEVTALKKILQSPKKPVLAIVGGSKIDTKIKVLERLLDLADNLFVGGALGNTLLHAKGVDIKNSLYEQNCIDMAKFLLEKSEKLGKKILLPVDCVYEDKNIINTSTVSDLESLPKDKAIFDIGPKTILMLNDLIEKSKTIIWNGPLGFFENQLFRNGTISVFESIANSRDKISVIGGGDTINAISGLKQNNITHISTGGGAMLEFIEKGTLPGIEALKK